MFVLKIHVLDSRDGAGGGGEGKMKEVLRSSADDGHGHGHGDAARMEAEEAEEEGQEQEQEEQGLKTLVSAFAAASEETTRGITHLFRNVSASAHSSGPLPVSIPFHLRPLSFPLAVLRVVVYISLEDLEIAPILKQIQDHSLSLHSGVSCISINHMCYV
jgi:hypothetical protein